jgi:hypothetical protein
MQVRPGTENNNNNNNNKHNALTDQAASPQQAKGETPADKTFTM